MIIIHTLKRDIEQFVKNDQCTFLTTLQEEAKTQFCSQ